MRNKFLKKPLSLISFSILMSIINLFLYNIPFLRFAISHTETGLLGKFLLIFSLIILLFLLNAFACYFILYLFRYIGKVIIALTQIINSTCTYFVLFYSVIIDGSMVGNVFNTRYSEASGFISWQLIIWVLLLGIVPALYVLLQKLNYDTLKHFGIFSAATLSTSLIIILCNFNQILWISKYDTELGGLLMPWSYTVNSCRVLSMQHSENKKEILLADGQFLDDQKTAVILVIGESARRSNFSLYGYSKPTNPLLSQRNDIHVLLANSYATYTTASVKAILEYRPSSELYELLPNYLFRHGADVSWRTSNWGEPPIHVPEYIKNEELAAKYNLPDNHYDKTLFYGIKEHIERSENNKVFIILHTSTSHGPAYTSRYPKSFEFFTPVSENVEEGHKNIPGLINAYDNTILYTDFLLASLIDTLATLQDWKCAMLFVSDHGESLGENSLFMHGMPRNIAPKEQYEIPFIVWTSPNFRSVKKFNQPIGQHSVFHSVLNLFHFSSPIYNPDLDIFETSTL